MVQIYKKDFLYKKVGVVLQGVQPEQRETFRLYNQANYEKDKRLMQSLDKISQRFDRNAIAFGVRKQRKCGRCEPSENQTVIQLV